MITPYDDDNTAPLATRTMFVSYATPSPTPPPLALTPQAWLDLLPLVVAQLQPEEHEEFVIETLRKFDAAGAEIGGCLLEEW